LGLVRVGQRRTAEGQVLLEQALQIYGKNLRPDDLNLAQAYLDLAVAYKLGGRLQESQEMDGKALRIQEQVFGIDSPVARETRARIKQNSNREQLQNPKTSGKPPVQHAKAN
jgi:tetratricopeptide (TPR) repeat protein